jgi:cell division protein FtsB
MSSAAICAGPHAPGIKAALSPGFHGCGMVTRKRLRSILTALGLYVIAALLIGYFGANAFSGNHGLKAKQDIDQQIALLSTELSGLQAERARWQRRVALLKSRGLDPDMLDERARAQLDYVHPNELTLMLDKPRHTPDGGP